MVAKTTWPGAFGVGLAAPWLPLVLICLSVTGYLRPDVPALKETEA
jgi:hypothetical protein